MRDQYEIIRGGNRLLPPPPPDDTYQVPANTHNKENDLNYVGPLTSSQAELLLKPNGYCVYYQVPEKSANILFKLPLCVAYKSGQTKEVTHWSIICRKKEQTLENMWYLHNNDSTTFPTLKALIKGSPLLRPPPAAKNYEASSRKNSKESDLLCYVGPLTASQAAMLLKPSEFRIYYQVPEKSAKISDKLRLFLAYRSSEKKEVFHFPIVCSKGARTTDASWSIRYTGSPTFPTLSALIKYHEIYAYKDPHNGHIDTFPVWKDAIIDDDDSL